MVKVIFVDACRDRKTDDKRMRRRDLKKKKKRERKQMEKDIVSKNSDKDKKNNEVCKHYLRGSCKYGFSGKKTLKDGTNKCNWEHPKLCTKYMNQGNGVGGCNGQCDKIHPSMCRQSMTSGVCDKFGTGQRCMEGYHKRGTTGPNGGNINMRTDTNSVNKNSDQLSNSSTVSNTHNSSENTHNSSNTSNSNTTNSSFFSI